MLCANAQFISFQLPIDNVMNSYQIRCVTQDKHGFIWMGTGSGLYRYDGYQYKKIQTHQQPDLLPNEAVQAISRWGSRYLWIRLRSDLYSCYDTELETFVDWSGQEAGNGPYQHSVIIDEHNLWLYDKQHGCCHVTQQNGTFQATVYQQQDNQLPTNHVNFVSQEANGRAWVGTDQGLVRIQQGKTHVAIRKKTITCAQQMPDGSICFVSESGDVYRTHPSGSMGVFSPANPLPHKVKRVALENNQLILCTEGTTYCYDISRRTLTPHPKIHVDDAQVVVDNRGNKVVFDHDGYQFWYITPKKTYQLSHIYNKELTLQNAGGRFKFIYDCNDRIWISTYGNGLFVYDTKTSSMQHLTQNDQPVSLIATDYLQNIFEDHSGRLWICQENFGVCYLGEQQQQIDIRYFTTPSDLGHSNTVRLIQPAGDKIFVGNRQNALWVTDNRFENATKENPYNDDVVAISTDHQGRLWAGTRNRGVFINGKPVRPAVKGKISDILCDSKGRVWISIFDGGIELVTTDKEGSANLRRTFFMGQHTIAQPRSMIQDRRGYIWLCSNRGVYRFLPDQLIKNDTAYQYINVSGNDANSDEVHCLYEDSHHRIWAGTTGYGLACFDEQGHLLQRYNTNAGLPNNTIESIIEDQDGSLWVGTSYGLARFNEQEQRFNVYFLSPKPQGMMYTEGCVARLSDGRLAWGTLYGMQVFNPKNIKPRPSTYSLTLTDIHINGVALRSMGDEAPTQQAVNQLQELKLDHDQNSLTFYFSSFEYISTRLVKYSYMLEGYDKYWSEPSALNFASYKNLRPGDYKLHVRSYNIYGMPNDQQITLSIVVRQPWWNTWWAWLFYIFFLGAISWAIWRQWLHTQELRNKIKVENQLTEFKLRFFTNISHEFRTPLTIIRGAMDRMVQQGDIPGTLRQPISSMQKSTDRLLRLVNELLEFRKIQNQKLKLQLEDTDIVDFLRSIFLTFNETAENHRISYQFTTFAREYHLFVDRNYVDKMAYNLLSNAFKYTPHKRDITMNVKLSDDGQHLEFSVIDTGIGIAKDKQSSLFTRFDQSAFSRESIGIGLHMVSELVRVHHGAISFRENEGGGSIFTIALPTDKGVYNVDDFLVADNNELLNAQPANTQSSPSITYKELSTPPLNDRRVLVVDDDDDMRSFISTELGRYFVVSTASDGEEALKRIQANRPDLLISDVRMPGMNGFELTKKIRQDQELSDLPIILLTAISDEEKQVRGTEYGADDYLFKPFNAKVLVAKCSTLIGQRDRLKVKYAKEVVGSTPLADIIVEDADKKFLKRFESWVYNHLQDSNMQAIDFANSMKMGRTTFFKKVKQVTGMPPHEYIRKMRFTRAAELLKDPTFSISEVAYQTGFDDPNYFSRCFKEYFGVTASQFRKGKMPSEKDTAEEQGAKE